MTDEVVINLCFVSKDISIFENNHVFVYLIIRKRRYI